MNLIDWSDDLYSVKVAEIDNQHKKLVDIINKLHSSMASGSSNDVLSTIFHELIDYTISHFKYEEGLLARNGYESLEAHKREHEKFVNKILEYKRDFNEGKLFVGINVMKFLSDWLLTHITGTDQKYTVFLNSKGVN